MTALFATFDVFPMPKGASTHIAHSITALNSLFGRTALAALGFADMPGYQLEGDVTVYRCLSNHPNFLKRTEYYCDFLYSAISNIDDICSVHFRDIWSGNAVFDHPSLEGVPKVFEVNGLPSIELPYHYPRLLRNPGLLAKFKAMEDRCLSQCCGIITVSEVTKKYLVSRGVPSEKIHVIPNTAGVYNTDSAELDEAGGKKIIMYAGTLSRWQGIETLLGAFEMIKGRGDVCLVIAGSTGKNLRALKKIIRKAGIEADVKIFIGMDRESLFRLYGRSLVSVAPLIRCGRNEIQGCSPLKIIESMSAGTPVVASRIAVCEEIISHGSDGWLVPPDSPRALAAALEMFLDDPALARDMGVRAEERFNSDFAMDIWLGRFSAAYKNIISTREELHG